jgi:hypothetical protein
VCWFHLICWTNYLLKLDPLVPHLSHAKNIFSKKKDKRRGIYFMTIIKYSIATLLKYKLVIALECKEGSILKKVAHFIMCVQNYPPFSSFQMLWWLCYLGVIFAIFLHATRYPYVSWSSHASGVSWIQWFTWLSELTTKSFFPQLLIHSPHLLVRATSERFLPTGGTFSKWEPLVATSAGTLRSLVTHTNKFGWVIS